MFGVRIIAFAGALIGAAVILPHDPAEARTHRQDSYARYSQKSYVRHYRTTSGQHHTRKAYAHKSTRKSYAHKSTRKSYAHKSTRKSYAHKSSQRSNARISVSAHARAGTGSRNGAFAKVYAAAGPRSARGLGPRPARWCGWWMRTQKGGGPELNLARNWKGWGRPSGPQVGAVVVWSHHVGVITGRTAGGQWIVKSGNDGGRVRERPRSVAGAVFRVA
jgi:hypothetical protein